MPKPQLYMSRKDLGWKASPASYANPRSGIAVHYDSVNQGLAGEAHGECVEYWQNTRKFHTGPSRGWADIGYSFMACAHGYVMEGRGLFKQQAAQPGGNSTYYSVTLATGPTDTITSAQIEAVRQLRAWLMEPESSIASTVKGHRDFIATSCPGDKAYALVRNGTFAKPPAWNLKGGAAAPDTDETEGDFLDMADMVWFSSSTTQKLKKGEPVCITWDNATDKKVTKDNQYATIAFADTKVLGTLEGEVIAKDADGNLIEPNYEVMLGKVKGDKAASAKPSPLFRAGSYPNTKFARPITEVTQKDERLRVYVQQLGEGDYEWRGGKATMFQSKR